MAPHILTTGGAGGDPVYTEGGVGQLYLVTRGVPSEAIIVEREGESTVYSIAAAAEIMRRMELKSCIVVSDGYHIFRVKKMLESRAAQLTAEGEVVEHRRARLAEREERLQQRERELASYVARVQGSLGPTF